MAIKTPNEKYIVMDEYWTIMDDVTSTQRNIHSKTITYLPRLEDMTDDQYTAYLTRSSFPLFTKHALSTFVGMVMRKKVKTENVPDLFLKNMDGSGTSLQRYVNNLAEVYLKKGRVASFVDYGKRSKVLMYNAESILDWRTKTINDTEQLVFVKLRELRGVDEYYYNENEDQTEKTIEDEFEEVEPKYQYRILTLEPTEKPDPKNKDQKLKYRYRQRLYDDEDNLLLNIIPESSHKPLDFIPIVIHGGNDPDYPPLIGIAEENFNHYRLDADYKHGLHYIALPTPYTTGVDPEDKNAPKCVGPTKLWFLPEGSTAGMLEFSGAGIESISKAKEESYDNIVVLSSRVLAPPSAANETATAANIRNAGETASLAEIISQLSEELGRVVHMAVNWTQEVNDILVIINSDFLPNSLSGSDVASYVSGYLKGGMSFQTLFSTLKKGEIQAGDRDLKEEISDIKEEQLERIAMEVLLAEKLAKATAEEESEEEPDEGDKQQKEGEQVNKGQDFKEN